MCLFRAPSRSHMPDRAMPSLSAWMRPAASMPAQAIGWMRCVIKLSISKQPRSSVGHGKICRRISCTELDKLRLCWWPANRPCAGFLCETRAALRCGVELPGGHQEEGVTFLASSAAVSVSSVLFSLPTSSRSFLMRADRSSYSCNQAFSVNLLDLGDCTRLTSIDLRPHQWLVSVQAKDATFRPEASYVCRGTVPEKLGRKSAMLMPYCLSWFQKWPLLQVTQVPLLQAFSIRPG